MTLGQMLDRPLKHMSHSQQLTPGSTDTLSPTLKSLTSDPTSRTCPADSWPRMISWVTQQSPIRPVFQLYHQGWFNIHQSSIFSQVNFTPANTCRFLQVRPFPLARFGYSRRE